MIISIIRTCDICRVKNVAERRTTSDPDTPGWLRLTLRENIAGRERVSNVDVCPDHAVNFAPFIKQYAQ